MPFTIPGLTSMGVMPYCVLGLMVMAEGPIATLIGGAAITSGILLPLPVYCSVVLGNLTADLGWYSLGRFCRPGWLMRLAPRLRVDPGKVAALQEGIQKNAPRLLFLAKLTVGLPIPALLATGISRVPVRRWGFWLLLGELIKSAVLVPLRSDRAAGFSGRADGALGCHGGGAAGGLSGVAAAPPKDQLIATFRA